MEQRSQPEHSKVSLPETFGRRRRAVTEVSCDVCNTFKRANTSDSTCQLVRLVPSYEFRIMRLQRVSGLKAPGGGS